MLQLKNGALLSTPQRALWAGATGKKKRNKTDVIRRRSLNTILANTFANIE